MLQSLLPAYFLLNSPTDNGSCRKGFVELNVDVSSYSLSFKPLRGHLSQANHTNSSYIIISTSRNYQIKRKEMIRFSVNNLFWAQFCLQYFQGTAFIPRPSLPPAISSSHFLSSYRRPIPMPLDSPQFWPCLFTSHSQVRSHKNPDGIGCHQMGLKQEENKAINN